MQASRWSLSFSGTLLGIFALWPLWWALGIEQFLVPAFIILLALWQIVKNGGKVTISQPARWALALAAWALLPILWVDREYLAIFIKEKLALWSQAFMLLLATTAIKTERQWWQIVKGLEWISAYLAVGGIIFVSGLWQGSFISLLGRAIPAGMRESSAFFGSVANRSFGVTGFENELFTERLSSFALHFTDLSLAVLLLIPFLCWRIYWARGGHRVWRMVVLAGLFVCLLYAQSRVAYVAASVGLGALVVFVLGVMHKRNRIGAIGLAALGIVAGALMVLVAWEAIQQVVRVGLFELRPGSSLVRMRIYAETLALLPEHPIAGWGTTIRIPGMRTNYSAGSHSSYLGMLFQHGVVGLFLYIGLWWSIWRIMLAGVGTANRKHVIGTFWWTMVAAMLAFNIREAADTWTWDQTLTIIVWSMWALIVSAARLFQAQPLDDRITQEKAGFLENTASVR